MDTREKVKKVFENHMLMRLATIDEEGLPTVRSVDFVADTEDESIVYFMSFKLANKVKELQNNNNVHILVDEDANSMEELSQLLYVRGSGKAYPIQSPGEMQKSMGLYFEKYPFLKDMPGDPSMMIMFKIELEKVTVTDSRVNFGHTEEHYYR